MDASPLHTLRIEAITHFHYLQQRINLPTMPLLLLHELARLRPLWDYKAVNFVELSNLRVVELHM